MDFTLFPEAYVPQPSDAIHASYTPPEKFDYGKECPVVTFPKSGGDGQPCVIKECRMPSRFFILEVQASTNSLGEPQRAYTVTTGSGHEMGVLLAAISERIAQGMIAFNGGTE